MKTVQLSGESALSKVPSTPRLGWCGPIQHAAQIRAAGLDYIEAQLVPMQLEDDACFAAAKARVADAPLPVEAMSYLFPHDARLYGEGADTARNRAYFDRVVQVLDRAQAQVVVLGSGWARNTPAGWTQTQTEQAFLEVLQWCAKALEGSGAMLVIEPLNRKESDFINSVSEGVRLVQMLNHPKVRGLADFYHMDEEKEPLHTLVANSPWLGHIHLADTQRLNPGTGQYDYPAFFGHLKAGGYKGRLSSECGIQGEPIEAMCRSVAYLRQTWAQAGSLGAS